MKINYHNEDYKSNILNIVVYFIVIIFLIFWWLYETDGSFEIGIVIFCTIIILLMILLLILSVKRYIKRKKQRNLNLLIIKNGVCVKGKIIKIYDNMTVRGSFGHRVIHDVTAEVEYPFENEKKNVVVHSLVLNIDELELYDGKTVNIYIYEDKSYVDIVNI